VDDARGKNGSFLNRRRGRIKPKLAPRREIFWRVPLGRILKITFISEPKGGTGFAGAQIVEVVFPGHVRPPKKTARWFNEKIP